MKNFIQHTTKKQRVIIILITLLLVAYVFCLPRKLFHTSYSTVVTDRNGELLGARIADDQQWRFPANDTVPDKFKTCIIEFEDQYFRYHWGVNPLAVVRALWQNVKEKKIVSGGSTISMQVIRLSRNKDRTVKEKIIEAILATRLEFRYSKNKILATYASHAPFGGNVVGLDAASWRYFGHSSNNLSWAEAATLAVLPNAPAMLHLSKNRPALQEKRNRLLKKLLAKDIIDEITYELAISENLPGEPLPLPQTAPHLVSRFYKSNRGEYCVSTINRHFQTQIEDLLERWNNDFLRSDIHNLAAIVIDVENNEVLAYCGNVNFTKNYGNQVDIILSERSTGSILKPFLYYVALNEGEILPRTLLPDIPISINGFSPQNFNRQFEGAVPASEAVARSLNIPLVYLLKEYSVPKFYSFLKENEIAPLPKNPAHYGLSLILGGAEARLGDVTNAYVNMGRSLLGQPNSYHTFRLHEKPRKMKTVFEPEAVWQVFDAIKEVNRPEEIDWHNIPTMQKIAWKTGTSYGFRDAWAVGVTSKYAVGVWVGNASGEGKPNLVGARTAGPVMFDIFDLLPSTKWFERPDGKNAVEAEICHQSGHLKGRFCEEVDTILICENGLRTEPCSFHVPVHLTPDEKNRVYENCIDESTVQQSWFVLPPAWAWFYKQHNPTYKSLPAFKPGCGDDWQKVMQFIYPQSNYLKVQPAKQLDGSRGDITLELAHNKRNATVFWHINNEYIAATNDFHTISFTPEAGTYQITAVDNEGNTISCKIDVL